LSSKTGGNRLPSWLRVKTGKASRTGRMGKLLRGCGVHTVCEEAHCPNIGECFTAGTATFMILGAVCTRNCRFCAVRHGRPRYVPPDEFEEYREMGLRHGIGEVISGPFVRSSYHAAEAASRQLQQRRQLRDRVTPVRGA